MMKSSKHRCNDIGAGLAPALFWKPQMNTDISGVINRATTNRLRDAGGRWSFSGTILVPLRYHCGTILVPLRYHFGTISVPLRYRYGT